MTTIQIRIDEKTKKQSRKVFEDAGLDLSSGVKMYLRRVAKSKTVPFKIVTENGYTPEEEQRIIRESVWALKHGKRYKTAGEAIRDILKKK